MLTADQLKNTDAYQKYVSPKKEVVLIHSIYGNTEAFWAYLVIVKNLGKIPTYDLIRFFPFDYLNKNLVNINIRTSIDKTDLTSEQVFTSLIEDYTKELD